MLLSVWMIALLIPSALLVIGFCVMCGIAAKQKGRSGWWAVMGLFAILGLIVVLLLDRSVGSEVSRRIEVDRMYQRYQRRSSPSEARSSAELRDRDTRTYPSGATGARGAESPVRAWLSKERGASDSDMARSPTQQRWTERSRRGREVQDEESPVAAFLSGRSGTDAEDSGKETTEGA